ncbi:S-fimbrial adhesin protein SfaS precursor [Leclercia adecarboxylata]|nr:S-fimbrial adhesin protein SfaS precursor [Leclercia adecarboxylata]
MESVQPVGIALPANPDAGQRLFYGQADRIHPTKFANTGSAKGLALELGDPQDNILLAPQASFNVLIDQNTHTATFPLAARYYVTSMPISAGTFSSVVQVTFTYQ